LIYRSILTLCAKIRAIFLNFDLVQKGNFYLYIIKA
jgi:hypothetical protein